MTKSWIKYVAIASIAFGVSTASHLQAFAEQPPKPINDAEYKERGDAFFADPKIRLRFQYQNFMTALTCHEARKGKLLQFVDSATLDTAKRSTRLIEEKLKAHHSDLDIDQIWNEASHGFGDLSLSLDYARGAAVDNIQSYLFRGETSVERRAHFTNQLRKLPDHLRLVVKLQCNAALDHLTTDAAKLSENQNGFKKTY